MRQIQLLLLLNFFLLLNFQVFAQDKMLVQGTVNDSTGTVPVKNAIVMAVRLRDSVLLGFQRTDAQGKFDLQNIPIDTFTLFVNHPNFEERSYYIIGSSENKEIIIPSVVLYGKFQEAQEVIIYANKEPIYYKGDTLVYVADSFQVAENAVVEDLLKKLPGIEIGKDGKITSQGKEISKVLVDGDEFFGSDPTIATKNLGAKGVQTVQVYEKKNEDAQEGDDETIQVLDLKLKDDAKKGYFGRTSIAGDFQNFYEGELLLNKFTNRQKISVFILGSNTPRSSFGYGDLNKFGLDNESRNSFDNGFGDTYEYDQNNNTGIPKTLKAGVYYSEKFGKTTSVNFNYSFYNTEIDSYSASRSQYFLADTTYYTDDSTRNQTFNQEHAFNLRFETNFDSLTKLTIRPRLSLKKADLDNNDFTQFVNSNNQPTRSTSIFNGNTSNGITSNNEIKLDRKFMKPKRELELKYQYNLNTNSSDGDLRSQNIYYDTLQFNDTINQTKIIDYDSKTQKASIEYYEPLNKFFRLSPQYRYEYDVDNQNKETYNNDASGNPQTFVQSLSNKFENTTHRNIGGLKLLFESRKYSASAGMFVRNVQIDNVNFLLDKTINQNVTNFLPEARFAYKPSQATRFQVRYNTSSSQPSINALQPVADNTNPNYIRTGNPNLLPNYAHTVNVNFNTWNALSGRYLYSGTYLSLTNNAFGNSVVFDSEGRQFSQTVNVDGNYNGSLWFGMGIPFYKKMFTFSPSLNGNTYRSVNYINTQQNITDNYSITPSLNLEFESDSLEFEIGGNFSYNLPKSSLNTGSNQPYYTTELNAGVSWTLPGKYKLESEVIYTINSKRTTGYNINYLIWNAAIHKYFLKTSNLQLSLLLNDILNQNISNQRQIQQNVITDNRTQIISRYFLLKLTYRFNNNKTKEEDGGGWH